MAEAAGARGVLIRGRYELLETLGSGGEARAVKALDHQHARLVALKMRPVFMNRGRDDLLREANVLLGLTPHPSLPLVREGALVPHLAADLVERVGRGLDDVPRVR